MDRETYEQYQAQEALQQQQIDGNQAMYAQQVAGDIQQAQAVMVEQVNPRKVVDDIILVLKGKEKLPDGSEVKVGEPIMNDKGISKVWFLCRGAINQRVSLSHYDEEGIKNIMVGLSSDLVDDLALNWKRYGIKEKTDLDMVNNVVLMNINAVLKSALDQNEKNWLGKISIEQISGQSRIAKPSKEGFWSKFKL